MASSTQTCTRAISSSRRTTIVAVDFGITGRLGRKERRFLAEILYGFITRDYMRVADVHFEAGYVPAHHDHASFAQAIRAIGEPIHGQSAETISMAKLLTLLFEVTELFDMETRPELLMLQKTMVVVEGVARTLNPRFNMWKASEEVVGGWIRDNLGPKRIVGDVKDAVGALSVWRSAAGDCRQDGEVPRRGHAHDRERPALRQEHGGRDRQVGSEALPLGPRGAMGDCGCERLYRVEGLVGP